MERYRGFLKSTSEFATITATAGTHVAGQTVDAFNKIMEMLLAKVLPLIAPAPSAINLYTILVNEMDWHWVPSLFAMFVIEFMGFSFAAITVNAWLDQRADAERYGSLSGTVGFYVLVFAILYSLKGFSMEHLAWPAFGLLAAPFYGYIQWMERQQDGCDVQVQIGDDMQSRIIRWILANPEATYTDIKNEFDVGQKKVQSAVKAGGLNKVKGQWIQEV